MNENERDRNREGFLVLADHILWAHAPDDAPNERPMWMEENPQGRPQDAYRGCEGVFWPGVKDEAILEQGLLSLVDLAEALAIYRQSGSLPGCRMLYCELLEGFAPRNDRAPMGFVFAGYDYGVLQSVWNHYSCLFFEVVCGQGPKELSAFSSALNDSLLFDNLEDVRKYAQTREEMVSRGMEGLETVDEDDLLVPIAIYVYEAAVRGER